MHKYKTPLLIIALIAITAALNLLLGDAASQKIGAEGTATAHSGEQMDIPDSPYFKHVDFYNMQPAGHMLLLTKFKTSQQETGYTCGPAAAMMVVQYLNGAPLHTEQEMGKIMLTNQYNGTNTKGMRKYFQHIGWQVCSSIDSETPANYKDFSAFVQEHLRRGIPIMVENVDWGGHWRVIIGYDTMNTPNASVDMLIMADPFDRADHMRDGYVIEPAEKFFYMWFDHQLFTKSEQQRQWLIAVPPDFPEKI